MSRHEILTILRDFDWALPTQAMQALAQIPRELIRRILHFDALIDRPGEVRDAVRLLLEQGWCRYWTASSNRCLVPSATGIIDPLVRGISYLSEAGFMYHAGHHPSVIRSQTRAAIDNFYTIDGAVTEVYTYHAIAQDLHRSSWGCPADGECLETILGGLSLSMDTARDVVRRAHDAPRASCDAMRTRTVGERP